MYKFWITAFCLLSFCITDNLNGQTLQWAYGTGSGAWDPAYSVAVDNQGNVYTAYRRNHDLGIYKNDALGNFVWTQVFTGTFEPVSRTPAMACDGDGNVYITGAFADTIDFDPGPSVFNMTSTWWNSYLLKLDSAGNFIWAKMFDGSSSRPSSMHFNKNGYIITSGWYEGIMDLDPGPGVSNIQNNSGANEDSYAVKLDTSGNYLWGIGINSDSNYVYVIDVTTDAFNNVILSGYFTDSVDFDPGPGVFYLHSDFAANMFVLKLNSAGNFKWVRTTDEDLTFSAGYSVTADSFGNIYTYGEFSDTCDFDPGPGVSNVISVGNYDCFMMKMDSIGNFSWIKSFGGPGYDNAEGIAYSNEGALIATGRYLGNVDFDPGPGTFMQSSNGQWDIYLLSLNTNGDLINAKSIGGTSSDIGNDVITDSLNNIYLSGTFAGTVDFNPPFLYNLTSLGPANVFTAKFSPLNVGTTEISDTMVPVLYPNPSDGNFTLSFSKACSGECTIYNLLGEQIKNFSFVNNNFLHCEISGAPGIYLIRTKVGETINNTKLIKY